MSHYSQNIKFYGNNANCYSLFVCHNIEICPTDVFYSSWYVLHNHNIVVYPKSVLIIASLSCSVQEKGWNETNNDGDAMLLKNAKWFDIWDGSDCLVQIHYQIIFIK